MPELSQEQADLRAKIQNTATIWGAVVGVIAGGLALWLLSGQGSAVQYGGALVVAAAAGFLVNRASFNSGAKSAKCQACGAAFSRSRTDRKEVLSGSASKEDREDQPDGSVKVTKWIEERYDVTDTYTCSNCGDETTNEYQITRRRDEETIVEPAPVPKKAASKGAFDAGEAPKPAEPAPKPASSGGWDDALAGKPAPETPPPAKPAGKAAAKPDAPKKPAAPKPDSPPKTGSKGTWD